MQIHLAVHPQLQQRVANQLTGPMICNISSPVNFKQRNTFFLKLPGAEEKMLGMMLRADGIGWRMLQKNQPLRLRAGINCLNCRLLQLPGSSIFDERQI
ncbi:hypothetical protein D3C74_372860 [compost metagenome]